MPDRNATLEDTLAMMMIIRMTNLSGLSLCSGESCNESDENDTENDGGENVA